MTEAQCDAVVDKFKLCLSYADRHKDDDESLKEYCGKMYNYEISTQDIIPVVKLFSMGTDIWRK